MGDIIKIMAQEQYDLYWHTYSDHLKDMMQNLMQSNQSTDVTLVCEDKTRFKAHKFVLYACSPVFQSIINDMPQNDGSVIYLRGGLAPEMKSILQFMYLGQATFYHDRMNEFLNVAKSLEIKEISKDVEPESEEDSSQDQENPEYVQSNHENTNNPEAEVYDNQETEVYDNPENEVYDNPENEVYDNPETEVYDGRLMEEESYSETKIASNQNDSGQYPCNKCDKQFAYSGGLYKHIKAAHEGIKYQCQNCNKAYGQKSDLVRHIQAVHDGIKFQCDMCNAEYKWPSALQTHKNQKHQVYA